MTKTSAFSTPVFFTLFHVLIINYVNGFREMRLMVLNDVICKVSDETHEDLHLTSAANDVIHIRSDVIDEQVPCPSDCTCIYDSLYTWKLTIDCENRTANITSLSHEINAYLTSVAPNLTQLELSRTSVTEIPESICQLERLIALRIRDNHFLAGLPDNCFTRLHQLQYFKAEFLFGLKSLQNGLFDNLVDLTGVSFFMCNISSIGSHLFDVTANLPNLRFISILGSELTEIDSWPVRRAQMINRSQIYLNDNRISRFSNSLGWHYDCNSAPLLSKTIDLRYNNITHLNDLFQGWNITGMYTVSQKNPPEIF